MEFRDLHAINTKNKQEYAENGSVLQYHASVSDLLPFYPIHWHEEMEIIKVQQGRGLFFIDGVKYEASAGDIIILRPFAMHSFNRLGENEMVIDAIVFNLRLLETDDDAHELKYFAPLLNERNSVPCIVRPSDSWYTEFDESVSKADLQTALYHLYNNRLPNAHSDSAEDKRCYTVKRAIEYIRAEYMNAISVEKIAKHCRYSEFYMMKLFKQHTGASIVDYVNAYRLTVAGRQLRDTNDDVATIAYQVGFNNVSYFNRQFKKLYGMTPKAFRASLHLAD